MRYTTNVVIDGVQAMTPAPVFRASEGYAAASRSVSGQECFGSAVAVQLVESVSGTGLAGAAGVLGLLALGEGLLERDGYAGQPRQERPRPVVTQLTGQPVLARPDGGTISERGTDTDHDGTDSIDNGSTDNGSTDNGSTDNGSTDNGSNKGDTGSKPMSPWGFRTSGPPG